MNKKIKHLLIFSGLISIALSLSGCASFQVKKENSYDQFTGIKSCKMENNWVNSIQGGQLAFNLKKLSTQHEGSDFYLEVVSPGISSFAIGKYLILTVNHGQPQKFKLSRTIAFGRHTKSEILTGYFLEAAVYLTHAQTSQLINAKSIEFAVQGEPGAYTPKELSGNFSNSNLMNLHQFGDACN